MDEIRNNAYWVHVVASVIMTKFQEYGFASDFAWQELFDVIEGWRDGKVDKKEVIPLVELTFGMEEKDFDDAVKEADKHLSELKEVVG